MTHRRRAWVRAQRADLTDWGLVRRVWRKAVRRGVLVALVAIWLWGVLVRVFVQDTASEFFAYCYYAMPPIVLFTLILAAALWLLWMRRRTAALIAAVPVVACGVWALAASWRFNGSVQPAHEPVRVFFWNINHGGLGWERIADRVRRENADIVGFVEATVPLTGLSNVEPRVAMRRGQEEAEQRASFWRARLPEYSVRVYPCGIALLVRGDLIGEPNFVYLAPNFYTALGEVVHAEVRCRQQTFRVMVVDLVSEIGGRRAQPLAELTRLVGENRAQPLVILGDFNTPPDSRHFDGLRELATNAFEVAGNGYEPTWPIPLPVLKLDQCWTTPAVTVVRCEAGWTTASDHRPLRVVVSATGG